MKYNIKKQNLHYFTALSALVCLALHNPAYVSAQTVTEGGNVQVTGTDSIGVGNNLTVSGKNSASVGTNNTITFDGSIVMGDGNQIKPNFLGETDQKGKNMVVLGNNNVGAGYRSQLIGSDNRTVPSQYQWIVEGTAIGTRNAVATGVVIGRDNATLEGDVAIGSTNLAFGQRSIAIGQSAKGSGTDTIAMGFAAKAYLEDAVSLGGNSEAHSIGGTAIGSRAKNNMGAGIALGYKSEQNRKAGEFGYSVETDLRSASDIMNLLDNGNQYKDALNKLENTNKLYQTTQEKMNALVPELEKKEAEMQKAYLAWTKASEKDYAAKKEAYLTAKKAYNDISDERMAIYWKNAENFNESTKKTVEAAGGELANTYNAYYSTLAPLSIGNEEKGITRQITNVAAGTKDTDVVNVAQLKGVARLIKKLESTAPVAYTTPKGDRLVQKGEHYYKADDVKDLVFTGGKFYASDQIDPKTGALKEDATPTEVTPLSDTDKAKVQIHAVSFADGSTTNATIISNVAAGVNDNDAVNVSQLKAPVLFYSGGSNKENYQQGKDTFKMPLNALSFDFGDGLKVTKVTKDGKDIVFVGLDKEAIKNDPDLLKGEQGNDGDKGDQGNTGNQGDQGNAGDKGDQGNAGDKGDQGNAGDKGDQGNAGDKSDQGNAGDKGDQGNAGDKGIAPEVADALTKQGQAFSQALQDLDKKINGVGALSSAMSGLKTIQYDPTQPTQFMASVGHYKGSSAVALGLAHYSNDSHLWHAGLAWGDSNTGVMANLGMTIKFSTHVLPTRPQASHNVAYKLQEQAAKIQEQDAKIKFLTEKMEEQNEQIKQLMSMLKR